MAKWTKRILLTLGILIVLLLAAVVILPIVFKDKIEAAVKAEVNNSMNAVVDWGEWDVTLLKNFPDLTVEVADVKVSNVAPFEGMDLARIGEFSATVDIKSVFGDNIDIKRVGLIKPFIHIKVLEDGSANYDIAKADSAVVDATAEGGGSLSFGLREYWMEDAHIIYEDLSLPVRMDFGGVQHRGTGDFRQDVFNLSTTSHIDSVNVDYEGITYLKNAKSDIKADLEMDLANMKFTFKENEISLNELVVGADGWLAMPTDDIVMDLTWAARRTDLKMILSLVPAAFASDLNGVDMSGSVAFDGYIKGTYGTDVSPGFGLNLKVDNGRFKYPDLPASCESIFIDLAVTNPDGKDTDGMVIDLKRFALNMAGNPVEARMYLIKPTTDPTVDAELRAKLDLASIRTVVPMEKGDDLVGKLDANIRMKGAISDVEAQRYDEFTAEGNLTLMGMTYKSDSIPTVGINSLIFDFSPRFLALTGFDGSVGSSKLQAKGRMDNYLQWWLKDSTLVGSFDLAADKFDMNELMGSSESEGTAEAEVDTTALSVVEVPGNIDFRMGMTVGELKYDDMVLKNLRGGMRVHEKRIDLKEVFFNLFGGSVEMDGAYDTKNMEKPMIDLHYDVKDLDIEETVKYVESVQKMAPIAKTAKGKFSTDLTMKAQLDQQMQPIMSTLTGNGTLRTKNVRIDGFQPLVDIAKALKIKEIENTTLQDVFFAYRFADGKMITDPFDVKIDRIKANVGGSTAFEDQAIDYDMKAKVPSDIFGAGAAQAVSGLLGQANKAVGADFKVPEELDVTVKITGTIEKPVVKPVFAGGTTNVKDAVITEVKAEVNEQIGKAKEEAIARAREEAAKLVAEAQKQADNIKAQARGEAARVKAEIYANADKLVNDAKDPISKAAAKVAAQKFKQEADKKEQQFVAEADRRADDIVNAARKKGDDLIAKAEATDTTVK
jgi:uncharacterized protein involved in outer membrane biogenesis